MYSRSVPSYTENDEDEELLYSDFLDANNLDNDFDEEIVRA